MKGRVGRWNTAWRGRLRALKREAHALLIACRDERTPWYAKLAAGVVVAYAFSPIDLIPDFIPVLGLLDDLLLVPLGVVLVRRMIPAEVLIDCHSQIDAAAPDEKPIFWSGAVAIAVVWAAAAYITYRIARVWL